MSNTAVALVKAGKVDITDKIESFSFEESTEKDNLVEIRIKDTFALAMSDSPALQGGKVITFQFGYLGQHLSPVHTAVITDAETTYGTRITLTIRATDGGAGLKKGASDRVWKGLTSSQIAQKIALSNKLKAVVDKTTEKLADTPQGGKSDFDFLRDLAQKEKGGHYQTYVLGDTLYYTKRDLGKKSSITYNYGVDDVISFAPKWRETTADPAANEVKTIGVDPFKKKVVSSADRKTDGTSLSEYPLVVHNSNAEQLGIVGAGKRPLSSAKATTGATQADNAEKGKTAGWSGVIGNAIETGKKLLSPDPVADAAKGKHAKNAAKIKILEATLIVVLNPSIRVGMVITMGGGIAKRHSGNWLVNAVRHNVGGAGKTTVTLGKESIKKGSGQKVKANTTVGAKAVDTKKEVRVVYSADGTEVGRIREGSKRPVR